MENQLAVISDYGRQLFFCFFRIYIPGGRDAQSAERGGGGAGRVLLYIQHNPCSLKPPLSADVPYSRSRHYKSKSLHFIQPALRRCHQRVIGMVNHESRCGSGYLFNVLFLDIVDFHLVIVTAFGIVGGQGTGFFKEAVGKVGAALSFYDDMGSGNAFCVEPPVVSCGQLEGEFLILVVVLSHVNVEAVRRNVVEGLAGDFRLFVAGTALFAMSSAELMDSRWSISALVSFVRSVRAS